MEFFNNVYKFIESLSLVDIVFFVAIITLLILIVTLIYFIKINKEVLTEDDLLSLPPKENPVKEDIIEKIESNFEMEKYNDEEAPLLDLNGLTEKLKMEESERVNCSEYEKEQEEKAIISYDELVSHNSNFALNYEKEELKDDLLIKKVNLNDLINKEEPVIEERIVKLVDYKHEEDFLATLKELNSLLN